LELPNAVLAKKRMKLMVMATEENRMVNACNIQSFDDISIVESFNGIYLKNMFF
jgi:hypothetical protein